MFLERGCERLFNSILNDLLMCKTFLTYVENYVFVPPSLGTAAKRIHEWYRKIMICSLIISFTCFLFTFVSVLFPKQNPPPSPQFPKYPLNSPLSFQYLELSVFAQIQLKISILIFPFIFQFYLFSIIHLVNQTQPRGSDPAYCQV